MGGFAHTHAGCEGGDIGRRWHRAPREALDYSLATTDVRFSPGESAGGCHARVTVRDLLDTRAKKVREIIRRLASLDTFFCIQI